MPFPSDPDVVITGMGAVSPLGLDVTSTWKNLKTGCAARQDITLFETEGCRCRQGAQVVLPTRSRAERRFSRASRLALLAAAEALAEAQIWGSSLKNFIPLCISTTGGAMEWGESFLQGILQGDRRHLLSQVARYQPQQQVLDLQQTFGLRGPVMLVGNACASGANAIGHGFDIIRSGVADCVLVGGFEALTELIFVGFDCLQAMSTDCCRPFDQNRNGLMLGEGAAFLVLENSAHAETRGVEILGRLLGYGHSTDLYHLTQPAPTGQALVTAMQSALVEAKISPAQIAYVNAHGTGTPMNDGAEALAYQEIFGEHLPQVAISSTKAAIGHTLGGAGCLEAIFTLCAARDAVAPPQLHNITPVPEMALSLAGQDRQLKSDAPVLSVNLGFGGSNAALVLSL
jgi:3-oxoacyl-[acyl-carrier-protein] synthase II